MDPVTPIHLGGETPTPIVDTHNPVDEMYWSQVLLLHGGVPIGGVVKVDLPRRLAYKAFYTGEDGELKIADIPLEVAFDHVLVPHDANPRVIRQLEFYDVPMTVRNRIDQGVTL